MWRTSCLDFGNLELELLGFQESSSWKNKIPWPMCNTQEAYEGRTKNSTTGSSDPKTLQMCGTLPNNSKSIKASGVAFPTLFGPPYACEQLFSAWNHVKSDAGNRWPEYCVCCSQTNKVRATVSQIIIKDTTAKITSNARFYLLLENCLHHWKLCYCVFLSR